MRCSPGLSGELLCAPKQLRHYHSPDERSWDTWCLSDREVERIDLENAANPEEADILEHMTADEMAVDGYYVVAGIARHEHKQGWRFVTVWDGYGLSEAAWEPMSAFIHPDGSINPIFRSHLVQNNEGQLLTCADLCPNGRGKTDLLVHISLLCLTELRRLVYPRHRLLSLRVSFGPLLQKYLLPPEVHLPRTKGEATPRIVGTPPGRLSCLQPNGWCVLLPQPLTTHSPRSVVPRTRPRARLGTRGVGSVWGAHLHTTTSTAGYLNRAAT